MYDRNGKSFTSNAFQNRSVTRPLSPLSSGQCIGRTRIRWPCLSSQKRQFSSKSPHTFCRRGCPAHASGLLFFDRIHTNVTCIRIIYAASAEITRLRIKTEATRTAVFTSFSLMRGDCMRLRKSWSVRSSELQPHRACVANAVTKASGWCCKRCS
jgi:hypothetical protein